MIFLALEQTRPILAYVNSQMKESTLYLIQSFHRQIPLSFMSLAHFLFVGRNILFKTELHLGHRIDCSLLTVRLPRILIIMTRTDDDRGPKGS